MYQVSPGTAADIFGLGSRFRFSGRTEKQAAQDAKMCARKPPTFSRTLSRRRKPDGKFVARMFHSIWVTTNMFHFLDSKSDKYGDTNTNKEIKIVSIPQPVQV